MQQQAINFEQQQHRPFVAMHFPDEEQAAQLERCKAKIDPLVLAFFATKQPGDEFHINDLTRAVWRTAPHVAADSPRRVMAALKDGGRLNYELVSRARSLYRVAAMEAA